MLEPTARLTYLDALKPPLGFELDQAIGTTFSLDLDTLFAVPMSFAMLDGETEGGQLTMEPVALLHALRRFASRTTVFCQGGRISLPESVRRSPLDIFLRRVICEVQAPKKDASFHPKVWFLRFVGKANEVKYRLITTSRNLTKDMSWDFVLVLDGEPEDRFRAIKENAPLNEFLKGLVRIGGAGLEKAREKAILKMADEIQKVRFEAPEPFEKILGFYTLGLSEEEPQSKGPATFRTRLFGEEDVVFDNGVVVSPFLKIQVLKMLKASGFKTLVSRPEEMDSLKAKSLEGWHTLVLDDGALPEDSDVTSEGNAVSLPRDLETGLHAKIYSGERGWDAFSWFGSANATNAGMDRNVEFLVGLSGKKSRVGIDALFGRDGKKAGFFGLLSEYKQGDAAEQDAEAEEIEMLLAKSRRAILGQAPRILVTTVAEGRGFRMNLQAKQDVFLEKSLVAIQCWPVTLNKGQAQLYGSGAPHLNRAVFDVSSGALTSFIAFELSAGTPKNRQSLSFVLNLPIEGEPHNWEEAVLGEILGRPENLERYFKYLLSDSLDKTPEGQGVGDGRGPIAQESSGPAPTFGGLFEDLARTFVRQPARLDEVAKLVHDLRKNGEAPSPLPAGFDAIWKPLWEARLRQKGGKS